MVSLLLLTPQPGEASTLGRRFAQWLSSLCPAFVTGQSGDLLTQTQIIIPLITEPTVTAALPPACLIKKNATLAALSAPRELTDHPLQGLGERLLRELNPTTEPDDVITLGVAGTLFGAHLEASLHRQLVHEALINFFRERVVGSEPVSPQSQRATAVARLLEPTIGKARLTKYGDLRGVVSKAKPVGFTIADRRDLLVLMDGAWIQLGNEPRRISALKWEISFQVQGKVVVRMSGPARYNVSVFGEALHDQSFTLDEILLNDGQAPDSSTVFFEVVPLKANASVLVSYVTLALFHSFAAPKK